jgi:hypothetical protein
LSRGQRGGSRTVINLSFLDRSRYFFIKQLLIYAHEAEWAPFQTRLLRIGSAGNRTRDHLVSSHELRLRDHRGFPLCNPYYMLIMSPELLADLLRKLLWRYSVILTSASVLGLLEASQLLKGSCDRLIFTVRSPSYAVCLPVHIFTR